jgi:hypothetical protein
MNIAKGDDMKKIGLSVVFILSTMVNLTALENYLFFELAPEFLYTDKEFISYGEKNIFSYYTMYSSVNLGWYGKFNNGIGIIGDINAAYLPLHQGELPKGFPEIVTFYKFGLGPAYIWKNFMLYSTPNISIINNSLGLSGTFGLKGFFFINAVGLSIGLGIDTPAYLFDTIESFEPKISFRISFGLIYNLSRKRQIAQETENQRLAEIERARQEEEQRQRRLEQERIAHEAMLKEKGLTEEEWQIQEFERHRQEEIRRQQERREQNALSQLIQNLIDVGFNIGEPFQVGDIVSIPYGLFTAIDYSHEGNVNSYLVIMNDYSTPTRPFYIESIRQLDSIGPMRIEYLGPAQYLEGRVPKSTLRFREAR